MTITSDTFKNAISTISEDEAEEPYLNIKLFKIFANIALRKEELKAHPHFVSLVPKINSINQDIWDIETIVSKLCFLKSLWTEGTINDDEWSLFAGCDIDLFHVVFRSVFDTVAEIIGLFAPQQGTVKKRFSKLRTWVDREENKSRLDQRLSNIVKECGWFEEITSVRDSIVHWGGSPMVFRGEDKILFQILEGANFKVKENPIYMHNENGVVDFEPYAAFYFINLLSLLEDLSNVFSELLPIDLADMRIENRHPGLKILLSWMKALEEKIA